MLDFLTDVLQLQCQSLHTGLCVLGDRRGRHHSTAGHAYHVWPQGQGAEGSLRVPTAQSELTDWAKGTVLFISVFVSSGSKLSTDKLIFAGVKFLGLSQPSEPLWANPDLKSGTGACELISASKQKKCNLRMICQTSPQNLCTHGKSDQHQVPVLFELQLLLSICTEAELSECKVAFD